MTICTIDVHSRDVVSKMILNKIESSFAFMWQSQLRHRSLPTPGRPAGENKKVVDIDLNQFCNWCKNFGLDWFQRWDETEEDCFANICDAEFRYWHEYLGNTPRLVITPLTDR